MTSEASPIGSMFSKANLKTVYHTIAAPETYPPLVAGAQTYVGKVLLLILLGALLKLIDVPLLPWLPITLAVSVSALAARYRFGVLPILTYYIAYHQLLDVHTGYLSDLIASENLSISIPLLTGLMLLAFSLFSVFLFWCARRFPTTPLVRHPFLTLLTVLVVFWLLARASLVHGMGLIVLWAFILTLIPLFWLLAYALIDQRNNPSKAPFWGLGRFCSFWDPLHGYIGKNVTYLRRFESTTAEELAITQIKGLKLIFLFMGLWSIRYIMSVVAGLALIPSFSAVLYNQAHNIPFPTFICWESLVYQTFFQIISYVASGHLMIGIARMAGFRLLRNTYRLLESRTLAEFWNRYTFYFKEVLVEFFFYPTFIKYFRQRKRLRIAFATFMAVGLGNVIFHFIELIPSAMEESLSVFAHELSTYAFYCLLLAGGIIVSQLRQYRVPDTGYWIFDRFLPLSGILFFFCILEIFDFHAVHLNPLHQHLTLLFHLFGLDIKL